MSNLPKIDGILRGLREDASGSDVARQIGEAVKERFPKGKIAFEPANEFNIYYGLRKYTIKSGQPIVIEFEFDEDTPMGPGDSARDSYHRDYSARYDSAMQDWREFLTDEIGRIAERIKPGLELTDITTPTPETVMVTLERGSI